MYLYHYSKERYPTLLTKRRAGATIDEIRKSEKDQDRYRLVGAYVDHISFFFDPIPSKTVADIFGSNHHTWYKGNTLFEYVIDVDQFNLDVGYSVVESRNKTAFMDAFIKEHNWVDDDPALLALYLKQANKLAIDWGEDGRSLTGLKRQITLNVGKTKQAYIEASKRADFEEGRNRYATNVPHVMAYPATGEATYCMLNKVTIGNDARASVIKRPVSSLRWM